jgi:hypothetical protein
MVNIPSPFQTKLMNMNSGDCPGEMRPALMGEGIFPGADDLDGLAAAFGELLAEYPSEAPQLLLAAFHHALSLSYMPNHERAALFMLVADLAGHVALNDSCNEL